MENKLTTQTPSSTSADLVPSPNIGDSLARLRGRDETIFRWDDLPFETREQIFVEVGKQEGVETPGKGYFCYKGEMPDLVVAFRSLPQSHAQILQWYAKMNASILLKPWYPSRGRKVIKFNNEELAMIGRVVIELSNLLNDPNYRTTEKPTYFTKQFLSMPNLRSVQLYIDLSTDVSPADMEDFITQFPFFLQGCNKLSQVKVEIPTYGLNNPWRARLMAGINRRILKKTGVQGQWMGFIYEGFSSSSPYEEAEMWTWTAAPGETMDWTQELGWKCKNRCSTVDPPAWNFWDEFCGLEFKDGMFVVEWWENTTPKFNIVFS